MFSSLLRTFVLCDVILIMLMWIDGLFLLSKHSYFLNFFCFCFVILIDIDSRNEFARNAYEFAFYLHSSDLKCQQLLHGHN